MHPNMMIQGGPNQN
jgi:hypothetical protein